MSKIPVSVCIIAKNEEKYLEECLKRIRPYGFEIVVTDTGSTDKTKEIAQKYADKVLDFAWVNDFSKARNYCAENASNNWILALDCDEYVENINVQHLRIYMQKAKQGLGFLKMKMLAYDTKGRLSFTVGDVPRFYNRNYYHFEGAIHEQIKRIDGEKDRDTFLLPMEAVHQGYAIQGEEMDKKQERNINLIKEALKNEPENAYLHFQYAQSLYIMGKYAESVERFEKAMNYITDFSMSYTGLCVMGLAKAYCQVKRVKDAIEVLQKYENQNQVAQYAYIQGTSYLDDGQPLKALFYLTKAVNMKDADTMGQNLADSYQYIYEIYSELGQEEMGEPFRKKYEELTGNKLLNIPITINA